MWFGPSHLHWKYQSGGNRRRNISEPCNRLDHSQSGCGLVSGWPNCLSGDGKEKICNKQVTMVSFGINSIPANFNTVNYCVVPVENADIYIHSYDGVKKTCIDESMILMMTEWKCCSMSYNHCRVCPLITYSRENPEVKKSLETKTLIHKAKSDNTNIFRNFARSIGATPPYMRRLRPR